jgi:hypothetical protein
MHARRNARMSDRTQNARENVRIHIRIYMSDRTSEYMSDKRQRQIECQFVGITRRKFCFLPWQIPWFAAIYQSHKPLVPKTCFTISTMVLTLYSIVAFLWYMGIHSLELGAARCRVVHSFFGSTVM